MKLFRTLLELVPVATIVLAISFSTSVVASTMPLACSVSRDIDPPQGSSFRLKYSRASKVVIPSGATVQVTVIVPSQIGPHAGPPKESFALNSPMKAGQETVFKNEKWPTAKSCRAAANW